MKRLVITSLAALGLATVLVPGRASAQLAPLPSNFGRPPTNPLGTPVFSPYLNMARGGDSALNYYGLVRPQVQTQQSLQQLQQQQTLMEQQQSLSPLTTGVGGLSTTGLGGLPLVTGHETAFGNYSHFFPRTVMGAGQRR
jgi:hypothetical protein